MEPYALTSLTAISDSPYKFDNILPMRPLAWLTGRVLAKNSSQARPSQVGKVLVCALCLAGSLACGVGDRKPKADAKPAAAGETTSSRKRAEDPATKASKKKKRGELHLKVEQGVVLRTEPDPSSRAVRILDQPQVLRVLERRQDAYRVAYAGGTGWVQRGTKTRELRILATRSPPQASVAVDPEVLARARRHLDGGGRELSCGPYTLLTDLGSSPLLEACGRLASRLDQAYARRYGIQPKGKPRETLILFRNQQNFRAFAATDGPAATGYAGHARGADGYLALVVGDQPPERVVQTLVHEITHLISRRALGAPLPRWLSEGLADGLGDPATPTGLGPIQGLAGAEAVARRVLEIQELPDLRRVVGLDGRSFDRDARARDYEQGAVFVRFLMSDPERARSFKAYLKGIADGNSDGPEALAEHLGLPAVDWSALDGEVRAWLGKQLR